MDGLTYSQMIERLRQKGITEYTDGDIATEYAEYVKEQDAFKREPAVTPQPPVVEARTIPELKTALRQEFDKKKKGGR